MYRSKRLTHSHG